MTPQEFAQDPKYLESFARAKAQGAELEKTLDEMAAYAKSQDVALHAMLAVDMHIHNEPLSSVGPTIKHRYSADMI